MRGDLIKYLRYTLALLCASFALGAATIATDAKEASAEGYGYTEVDAAIDATMPPYIADDFKVIAYRESGDNPYAVNPYSGACGPFQFLPSTAAAYGYTCFDLQDPYVAAEAAYTLYLDYGFSPWAATY